MNGLMTNTNLDFVFTYEKHHMHIAINKLKFKHVKNKMYNLPKSRRYAYHNLVIMVGEKRENELGMSAREKGTCVCGVYIYCLLNQELRRILGVFF